MEKLSLIERQLSLIEKVFSDMLEEVQKIKAEHPEEWAEYEKMCHEYLTMTRPDISRRYYGKRKAEAVNNGEIHPETETD